MLNLRCKLKNKYHGWFKAVYNDACAPLEEATRFVNASIDVLSCFARHAGMTEVSSHAESSHAVKNSRRQG
jgi:hypothetical protein